MHPLLVSIALANDGSVRALAAGHRRATPVSASRLVKLAVGRSTDVDATVAAGPPVSDPG